MPIATSTIFGLTLTELALLAAAAGYLVSLIKDWRPVRALRRENGELRDSLKSAQQRIDELETKVHELEKQTVPVLQRELIEMARILERVGEKLEKLDGTVSKNTTAVEFLSKRALLDEAFEEHGGSA